MGDLPKPHSGAMIYEDDRLYVCLANEPVVEGHVVVVWKEPVADLHLLQKKDYLHLMETVDDVRNAMLSALDIEKIYLVYMDEIKHVHWHLIPRYDKKGFNVFLHKPKVLKDVSLASKIKANFARKQQVFCVRHGETELDKKKILKGHMDSKLTVDGIKSAEKLASKLKGTDVDVIYSSDLGRCVQTAEIINKEINVELIKTPCLRERDFGNLNGTPIKLVKEVLDLSNPDEVAPRGESFNVMKTRICKFLDSLHNQNYKKVLIVTHEGPLRAVLSDYNNIKFDNNTCDTKQDEVYELYQHIG